MEGERSGFALRSLVAVAAGLLATVLVLHLLAHDPCEELPAVSVPDAMRPEIATLITPRAPDEVRVFMVGASLTAGYPYTPDGSYADQMGAGLRAVLEDRKIHSHCHAKPALDSPQLAEMVEELVARYDPSLICVALGSNEFANRIFSGKPLVPVEPLHWTAEHASRARKLFRLLPSGGAAARQKEFQKRLDTWVLQSRNGQPWFGGLPVAPADQELLIARMERAMQRMSETCRKARVPLVFFVAVYGIGGFWPWGISAGGIDPEVDALVRASWRGAGAVDRARLAAELAAKPERADLHFLHGLVLRADGKADEARVAFEHARDLDQVPMHLTGGVLRAIRAQAKVLERPLFALDGIFQRMTPDGIQGSEYYLDYGHLSEEGNRHVAVYLARELSARGLLPALPDGWEPPFRAAAQAHFAARVPPASRLLAATNMAGANANFCMLFGNFRDAIPYITRAFEKTPNNDLAARLALAVFDHAGRYDELVRGTEKERVRRAGELYGKLVAAAQEGRLARFVDEVIAGDDVLGEGQ